MMMFIPILPSLGILPNAALLAITLSILYGLVKGIYNIYFHPLRRFPGPLLWRASHFPQTWARTRAQIVYKVPEFHAKYGPVVRIAPNELAFSNPQAWRDIYGHRSATQDEFAKYWIFYSVFDEPVKSIFTADRVEHARMRRLLSAGFSDRSMREQAPMIGAFVDQLIDALRANGGGGTKPLNMSNWFNWATFDLIGDLGFGSSFGCLEDQNYHPWVQLITHNVIYVNTIRSLMYAGAPVRAFIRFMGRHMKSQKRKSHQELVRRKLQERMKLGADRPDFIQGLLDKQEELDFETLRVNANLLIVAGSETTSMLLTGAVYLLCMNPHVLDKLAHEVRSNFHADAEITLMSVSRLTYMLAVLNESLRRYPPVGIGMPRQVPKGGETVAGQFIPEGTVVAVWQYATNHNPQLWTEPMGFHPERWMGDPRFANDRLDAMQPFGVGPRNCIGKNLAYAEMRLMLAKIIYNFDMRISDDCRDWIHGQRCYTSWVVPPLDIYLTPVTKK